MRRWPPWSAFLLAEALPDLLAEAIPMAVALPVAVAQPDRVAKVLSSCPWRSRSPTLLARLS